jgi:hypothetical protein
MNSGTFHITAQEWRYFSREKSIVHTTHLGQLPPTGTHGDTVLIDSTSPASNSNGNGSGQPPLAIPGFPGINVTTNVTFPRTTLPNVFGSVGMNQTILAQKNVVIQFAGWNAQGREFYITPNVAGWYYFYIQVQGDFRDINYLGPINPTSSPASFAQFISCTIDRITPSGFHQVCGNSVGNAMVGNFTSPGPPNPNQYWSASTYYLSQRFTVTSHGIDVVPAKSTIRWLGRYLGNAPDAQLTGYMFKIAEV